MHSARRGSSSGGWGRWMAVLFFNLDLLKTERPESVPGGGGEERSNLPASLQASSKTGARSPAPAAGWTHRRQGCPAPPAALGPRAGEAGAAGAWRTARPAPRLRRRARYPGAAPRPARPRLRSRLQCGLSAAAERATATSPGPLPSPPPPPFVFAARPRAMGGLPPGPPPAASTAAAAERGTLRGGKEGGEKDRKLIRCSFISI